MVGSIKLADGGAGERAEGQRMNFSAKVKNHRVCLWKVHPDKVGSKLENFFEWFLCIWGLLLPANLVNTYITALWLL